MEGKLARVLWDDDLMIIKRYYFGYIDARYFSLYYLNHSHLYHFNIKEITRYD